jgi:branched-chain amino acid transport system permease protein
LSKKSDAILEPLGPLPSSAAPASPRRAAGPAWLKTLSLNWFIPLLIIALWPLGRLIERDNGLDPYLARILILIGLNITLAVSLQLINGIAGQFSLGHAGFMAVGAYLGGYATTTYAPDFQDPASPLLFFLALTLVLAIAGLVLFALFLLIRRTARWVHPSLPSLLLVLIFAWLIIDIAAARRAETIGYATIWSRSILALCDLFFWLIAHGQPAALWLTAHLPAAWLKPLTFLLVLIGGGWCAAIAGLVVGLPTLRLRGDYLAIATLGFAEIIRVAFTTAQSFGGATGLSTPVYPNLAEDGLTAHYIFPWVYGLAILTILCVWRLSHSPKGRAIKAVREDEVAAAAVGIDPTRHKVLSFVIGAFFAGVAGAAYAHYDGYLNPNSFGILRSIELVVMVTLGGLGSIWGAVIAAAVLTWLPEFLRDPISWLGVAMKPFGGTTQSLNLPQGLLDGFTWVADNRMVIYSLLLIVAMLLRAVRLPAPLKFWRRPRPATNPLA